MLSGVGPAIYVQIVSESYRLSLFISSIEDRLSSLNAFQISVYTGMRL